MKPTAGQFKEVFDSYFHKDEDELAIGKVTNLGATLALKADKSEINALNNQTVIIPAGTATYNVPAGTLIEKFLIIAPTNINFSVGTTNGGQEIIETYQVVSSSVYAKDVYFEVATTIYFGGVAGDTIIKIFKR
ncbi:MAG: hypothetical protein Q8K66_13065 [Sediminibacterium sp.]|nr:hypothetical protein [Sediminibacterium sp.]